MLRALAVLLVAAFFLLATGVLVAFLLIGDLPKHDTTWRPFASGLLSAAPFVGAFLVAALGFVILRLRDETRTAAAPGKLAEAETAWKEGRRDEAFVLLRKASVTLRGEAPEATAVQAGELARVVLSTLGPDSDAELRTAVQSVCDAPLPLEPARLSLLLAYVDGHAEAAERRLEAAKEA